MGYWENPAETMSAWEALAAAIQSTALPLLLRSSGSISEFALTVTDTTTIGTQLLAHIQPWLMVLPEGGSLDLTGPLATLLQSQELGCRDHRDSILVALLLLKSLTSEDAEGEVVIWREALVRFTEGLPLDLTRRNRILVWQS